MPPRLALVWPTPNPAYRENRPPEEYIQPTVSGRVESGFFGCVRNNGNRFHEGLDLAPVARDRRGEAVDPVFSVTDGVVRHVNPVAGNSGYGRYVVIEHTAAVPPLLTLYAHLASIDPAVEPGRVVSRGQTIGIMGRSAGGYTIPRERAHLHFEIGFRVSDDFDDWYAWRSFRTPNRHGAHNGMNLIGINPIEFYDRYRAGAVGNFQDYLDQEGTAFTLLVRSPRVPDFVERYPSLLRDVYPDGGVGGWEIEFTWYGLPLGWRPLSQSDPRLENGPRVEILSHDRDLLTRNHCRQTLNARGRAPTIGTHTERVLQLLFGFRP